MENVEKLEKKQFEMYIMHKGWVSSYKGYGYRSIRYGNVNFEYDYFRKNASMLSYNQVITTIKNMQNVNLRYKIIPEDKFLELYELDKKENVSKYECIGDDILNPPKKIYNVCNGFLLRDYASSFFSDEKNEFPYYTLYNSRNSHTSPIIGYEFKDGIHIFETYNSFYYCENLIDTKYLDQITELKKYLESEYREKVINYQKYCDERELKNIEGEKDGK